MILFAIRRRNDGLYLTDFSQRPAEFGQLHDARQYRTAGDAGGVLGQLKRTGEAGDHTHEVVPVEGRLSAL